MFTRKRVLVALWVSVCVVVTHTILTLSSIHNGNVAASDVNVVVNSPVVIGGLRRTLNSRNGRAPSPPPIVASIAEDAIWARQMDSPSPVVQPAQKEPSPAESSVTVSDPVPVPVQSASEYRRASQPAPPGMYPYEPNDGLAITPPTSGRVFPKVDAEIVLVIPTAPRLLKPTYASQFGFYAYGGTVSGFVLETQRGLSTEELAKRCASLPNCVAFSSTGELKWHVDMSAFTKGTGVMTYTKEQLSMGVQPYQREDGKWYIAPKTVCLNKITVNAEGDTLAEMCANTPECQGFSTDGTMCSALDITMLTYSKTEAFYSKTPIPPLDYIVPTMAALVKEWQGCKNPVFRGKYHAFVVEASNPKTPGKNSGYLAAKALYGDVPCFTFVDRADLTVYGEMSAPPGNNGSPSFVGKTTRARGVVQQSLDYASAVEAVDAMVVEPKYLVFWEDDTHMCPGTFNVLEDMVDRFGSQPDFGSVKVGNGGSGILYDYKLVGKLVDFIKMHRGSENVDVQLWRFLQFGQYAEYLAKGTLAAHRGIRSSFKPGQLERGLWGRVECGNLLDFWWGEYVDCPGLEGWRCSVYKPGSLPAAAKTVQAPQPPPSPPQTREADPGHTERRQAPHLPLRGARSNFASRDPYQHPQPFQAQQRPPRS